VRFDRDAVLGAPSVGDDEQLSKAEEIELYRHYGVPVESGEGSVLPAGDASADHATPSTSTTATTATAATTAPVVGTSERTSTAASTSSGADTAVAESDADALAREQDRTGDVTALRPGDTGTTVGDDTSALAESTSGGVVTPDTGEDLPVLDPAVASTPVPEDQVTYVDTSQDRVADAEPQQPRPALHRVPPASPPPVPPVQPAPPAAGSGLSALSPLGAVAGVAAAVALALQARDRRARRRASASARAGRLGSSVRAGSAVALASARSTLDGVPDAAAQTRRTASRAAAKRQKRAAAAARRQRAQTAAVLAAASKAASSQKQAASASLGAASTSAAKAAAQQRKAARASLASASKTAAKQRKAAASSLSGATSRSSSATDSVTAVPAKVVKRGRKARKSLARKLWNTVVLSAAGGGYVLGAKAGRERYDELSQVASAVAGSPKVQSATEALSDPERRTDLLLEVQQQAGSLVGRRGEPRS
jgi:hypothetical protein